MLTDDHALLDRYIKSKSQSAFDELFRRHYKLVYTTCLRDLNDPDLASDTTQAVFLILMRQAPRLRNQAALAGWLFKTARFASLGVIRKEKRRKNVEVEFDTQSIENIPAEAAYEKVNEAINDALSKLPSADRDVILLRYFEGYTTNDIAQIIGINMEAAQKRITRALTKLRYHLTKATPGLSIVTLIGVLNRYADADALPHSEITTQTILSGSRSISLSPNVIEIAKGAHMITNAAIYKSITIAMVLTAIVFGSIYTKQHFQNNVKAASSKQQNIITLKDGNQLEIFGVTNTNDPLRFWHLDGSSISSIPQVYKDISPSIAFKDKGTYLIGRLVNKKLPAANLNAHGEPKGLDGQLLSGFSTLRRYNNDVWILYMYYNLPASTYNIGIDIAYGKWNKTSSFVLNQTHNKYISNNVVFTTRKPKYVSTITKQNSFYILNIVSDFDRRISIMYKDGKSKTLKMGDYDFSQDMIWDKKGGRSKFTIILPPDKIMPYQNIREIVVEERNHEQLVLDNVHAQPNK